MSYIRTGHPEITKPRYLHTGPAKIDAGDQAEKIDLKTAAGTCRNTEQPAQRNARILPVVGDVVKRTVRQVVAPHRVRRQHDAQFRTLRSTWATKVLELGPG